MKFIQFYCKSFQELSIEELYQIMAIRQEVFAIEQNCVYQDADGKDYSSWHVFGLDDDKTMVTYARLLPKGIAYQQYASIGRVLTTPSARGKGLGKSLMEKVMAEVDSLFGPATIKISAQTYLINFYQSFGFIISGEEYLEDGIPHISMIYKRHVEL